MSNKEDKEKVEYDDCMHHYVYVKTEVVYIEDIGTEVDTVMCEKCGKIIRYKKIILC